MNAKDAKHQINIQQWKTIIQDRYNSGLNVDEYCKQNGLTRHAYYYWLRIIREESIKKSEESPFAEIMIPNATPAGMNFSPSIELPQNSESNHLDISINGISVHITDTTSSALLARTLEVLRNVK